MIDQLPDPPSQAGKNDHDRDDDRNKPTRPHSLSLARHGSGYAPRRCLILRRPRAEAVIAGRRPRSLSPHIARESARPDLDRRPSLPLSGCAGVAVSLVRPLPAPEYEQLETAIRRQPDDVLIGTLDKRFECPAVTSAWLLLDHPQPSSSFPPSGAVFAARTAARSVEFAQADDPVAIG